MLQLFGFCFHDPVTDSWTPTFITLFVDTVAFVGTFAQTEFLFYLDLDASSSRQNTKSKNHDKNKAHGYRTIETLFYAAS